MNYNNYIEEYCTGCGLCHSVNGTKIKITSKVFPVCDLQECENVEFYENYCPVEYYRRSSEPQIWGKVDKAYIGYAQNKDVRFRAASGGALTEIASFLLEQNEVDAVIHISFNLDHPTENITCVSRTVKSVRDNCGSRYSISVPLKDILQLTVPNEKYAFIGKPCDVMALRQYIDKKPELKGAFPFLLSFFCAGEPSMDAQKSLLTAIGSSIDKCKKITYRGNGWPGYTTVIDNNGQTFKMEYKDAWGRYLGRDLRNICRFCLDGTGDAADIVCADFWHLTSNGEPDFSEHEGRNIIITRNGRSTEAIEKAINKGYLTCERDFTDNMSEFHKYQPHQYRRKTTMNSLILAMKIFGRTVPDYNKTYLRKLSSHIGNKEKIRYFIGTVKRILRKRI